MLPGEDKHVCTSRHLMWVAAAAKGQAQNRKRRRQARGERMFEVPARERGNKPEELPYHWHQTVSANAARHYSSTARLSKRGQSQAQSAVASSVARKVALSHLGGTRPLGSWR